MQDPDDETSKLGPGPEMKAEFSILRVSRSDAAEAGLILMLEGGQPDLAGIKDEPLFYPVFGRGRVLAGLRQSEMKPSAIDEAVFFLLGACSCEVKNLNPGWDLVMPVDWEGQLFAADERRQAAVQTVAAAPEADAEPESAPVSAASPKVEEVTFTPAAPAEDQRAGMADVPGGYLLLAGTSLVLLGGGWWISRRRLR